MKATFIVCALLVLGGMCTPAAAEVGAIRAGSFAAVGLWPFSESFGSVEQLLGVDFVYQYEVPRFFLTGRFGVRAGGNFDEEGQSALDVPILDVRIGRYLTGGGFAPFVHAGAGVHYCRAQWNEPSGLPEFPIVSRQAKKIGLSIMGGGGVTAFRTRTVSLQLMVECFVTLVDLDSEGMPIGILCSVTVPRGTGTD